MTERVCSENGQWTRRRNNFFCTLECGDGGQEVTGLIVGGVSSKKGKWPWHVAMYQEDPPNSGKYEFFCGGSLINSRAVITGKKALID
jgi:secreted trypsin-like serine protease